MTTNEPFNYAFIDKNNVVINICYFEGKNEELVEQIKEQLGAELALCTEEFGLAAINGTWNGQHFLYENGFRVPPTHPPVDNKFIYQYDWDTNNWIIAGPNRFFELE